MAENNNNDGLHRDIAQFANYQQGRGAFLAPAEDEMALMAEIIQEHEHGLVLDISSNYLIPPPMALNDIGGYENDANNLELGIILNLRELIMLSNIMPVRNIYIYINKRKIKTTQSIDKSILLRRFACHDKHFQVQYSKNILTFILIITRQ